MLYHSRRFCIYYSQIFDIEGINDDQKIDEDLADLISENIDVFMNFIMMKLRFIFFVFYGCSLDKQKRIFQFLIKKKTNCVAKDHICQDLDILLKSCKKAGLDEIVLSFDGNPSYLNSFERMFSEFDK